MELCHNNAKSSKKMHTFLKAKSYKLKAEHGAGLLEFVIAVSIITVSFFAVIQVSVLALKGVAARNDRAKALVYAQDGMEAVRNIRDGGWTANIATLNFGQTYWVAVSGGQWTLTQTDPGLLEGTFARTVVVDSVSRDVSDNIAGSGTDDPETKKVTVTVAWGSPSKTVQLVAYMTNILKN